MSPGYMHLKEKNIYLVCDIAYEEFSYDDSGYFMLLLGPEISSFSQVNSII